MPLIVVLLFVPAQTFAADGGVVNPAAECLSSLSKSGAEGVMAAITAGDGPALLVSALQAHPELQAEYVVQFNE